MSLIYLRMDSIWGLRVAGSPLLTNLECKVTDVLIAVSWTRRHTSMWWVLCSWLRSEDCWWPQKLLITHLKDKKDLWFYVLIYVLSLVDVVSIALLQGNPDLRSAWPCCSQQNKLESKGAAEIKCTGLQTADLWESVRGFVSKVRS